MIRGFSGCKLCYPEFNENIISRKFECEQRQNDLAIHTHKTFVNDEKVWVLGLYN